MKRIRKITALFVVVVLMCGVGCGKDDPYVPTKETLTFSTVTLPSTTLNFKPTNLPAGITYTVSDGTTTWTSGVNGFNGEVSSAPYGAYAAKTFTQVFYKGTEELTRHTVKTTTNGGSEFGTLRNGNDEVISKIPDIKIEY